MRRRRRRCLPPFDSGGVLAGLCLCWRCAAGMAHAPCVAGWRTAGTAGWWWRGLRMAACWRLKLIVPTSVLLCIIAAGAQLAGVGAVDLLAWSGDGAAGWHSTLDLSAGGARPDVLERPDHVSHCSRLAARSCPMPAPAEVFGHLAAAGPVRIERIVLRARPAPRVILGMTRRRRSG